MNVQQLAICFLICASVWCLQITGADEPSGQLQLKMVQVVFRHGNRTFERPYHNDPNANETFYPYGWDQLDQAGRQRAYSLGQYLRRLYGGFLGADYVPGVVNITSTDIPRTKMCAQLVAAGLFPPSDAQKWGSKTGVGQVWQPITLNFLPLEKDNVLYVSNYACPAYEKERDKVYDMPGVKSVMENDPELVEALVKNANIARTYGDIEGVHQTVRIEDFNNMIIPDWIKPFYPDRLIPFGLMNFKVKVWTRSMQRLLGGPLLKHILEQMERHKTGSPTKLWLYSAHDETVARLGITMRLWGDFYPYPDFSNAVIVELHADQAGKLFVKALFHNDTSKPPMPLKVEGCTELCPLDKVQSILDDVVPRDWHAECQIRSGSPINSSSILLVPVSLYLFVFKSVSSASS